MRVLERIRELGGFYLSDEYGAGLSHGERFGYLEPLDKVRFIPLEKIEEKYGRIIAVLDDCKNNDCYCQPVIWTEKYVVKVMEEYGREYLLALPRNPPPEAEKVGEGDSP